MMLVNAKNGFTLHVQQILKFNNDASGSGPLRKNVFVLIGYPVLEILI